MYRLKSELERIEFMIALTEKANKNGDLDNQLNRLVLAYLSELSGIPYEELYSIGKRHKKKASKESLKEASPKDIPLDATFH